MTALARKPARSAEPSGDISDNAAASRASRALPQHAILVDTDACQRSVHVPRVVDRDNMDPLPWRQRAGRVLAIETQSPFLHAGHALGLSDDGGRDDVDESLPGPLLNLNGQVRRRTVSRTGYDGWSSHAGAARLAAGRQQTA